MVQQSASWPVCMHMLKELEAVQGEETVAAEEWVELANGCLCCSVKTEFVSALEGLMLRRSRFDYILIETTGASHRVPLTGC